MFQATRLFWLVKARDDTMFRVVAIARRLERYRHLLRKEMDDEGSDNLRLG